MGCGRWCAAGIKVSIGVGQVESVQDFRDPCTLFVFFWLFLSNNIQSLIHKQNLCHAGISGTTGTIMIS